MKQITVYILLLFYAIAFLKPYVPVYDYIINYNYYKDVLCENQDFPQLACNGKCALAKEIKKENNSANKLQVPKILSNKHLVLTINFKDEFFINYLSYNKKEKFINIHKFYKAVYLELLKPPPEIPFYC